MLSMSSYVNPVAAQWYRSLKPAKRLFLKETFALVCGMPHQGSIMALVFGMNTFGIFTRSHTDSSPTRAICGAVAARGSVRGRLAPKPGRYDSGPGEGAGVAAG